MTLKTQPNFIFVLSALLAATYLTVALAGLTFSMAQDTQGNMLKCPTLRNASSFCQMDTGQHLSQWQKNFTTLPIRNLTPDLLAAVILYIIWHFLTDQSKAPYLLFWFIIQYWRFRPEFKLFDYLRQLFASGTLQPKLCN